MALAVVAARAASNHPEPRLPRGIVSLLLAERCQAACDVQMVQVDDAVLNSSGCVVSPRSLRLVEFKLVRTIDGLKAPN